MTCEHCGATLPLTAMFCGECGSAVAPPQRPSAQDALAETVVPGASAALPEPPEASYADRAARCGQCGAPMGISDIFCSECGFVARTVAEAYLSEPQALKVRTAPIVTMRDTPPSRTERQPGASPPLAAPSDDDWSVAAPSRGETEKATPAAAPVEEPADLVDADREIASSELPDETEVTRIVARSAAGSARFVLQFSTGEQAIVTGSGLLGRNPRVEPGERFDHVVAIHDPGRSVSKTHLEFGQERGEFWVLDRFSGNGSVLRQPDHPVTRCEPGRRYRVARGSRIDIGEQFFVVS